MNSEDWTSAVASVQALLRPRSVAVIGASRTRGTIGGETLHNLLRGGFSGPVLPVNPYAESVQSVLTFANVAAIPVAVDLAVIMVPAAQVVDVARACARKGARSVVVISAGFAETGDEGRARQDELLAVCRAAGMRLVGPNCMGIVNTDPAVRLLATFAPVAPAPGPLGIMSQSGALGLALMQRAASLGLGVSSFVSVGNKADVSGNDLIRYWSDDDATRVILLYLESFGNPRKFARIARQVARSKPIIAVKSGRFAAGARATASHTGALAAASDIPVDALFRQTGVIRTDTLGEMFDIAALLAHQPPPRGPRVGILTNAGGPAILCADACEAQGLELPEPAAGTRAALGRLLPAAASTRNPVDMIASASRAQYQEAARIMLHDPNIDALIVIFIPPLTTSAGEIAEAIVAGVAAAGSDKTVLTVFMQNEGVPPELRSEQVKLPSYMFPENAAIALAHAVRYGAWLRQPPALAVLFDDVRHGDAGRIVTDARARGESWLTPQAAEELLACYGIALLPQRLATAATAVGAAAASLAGPFALKAIAPNLVHKSDAGGVRLNIEADELADAARVMARTLAAGGHHDVTFLVQPMAAHGVEMMIGSVQDERFGPIIACGAGGTHVELLHDVAFRLAPLSENEARGMISDLKSAPLLRGYRGNPPADEPALVDLLLRVAQLVEEIPQITELDLNPVIVHETGVSIVDSRIRLS